jgi:GNAT superfamily N-acetyltransferase
VKSIATRCGDVLLVRPLRHGEARTVMSVFGRLGDQSRRWRFNGAKPCLGRSDLRRLATVDDDRRALVAYFPGDPHPVGIARLVRDGDSAEIALAVADEHQRRGIGTALAEELVRAARKAGVKEITGLVASDNAGAVKVIGRVAEISEIRSEGAELSIRAAIA